MFTRILGLWGRAGGPVFDIKGRATTVVFRRRRKCERLVLELLGEANTPPTPAAPPREKTPIERLLMPKKT